MAYKILDTECLGNDCAICVEECPITAISKGAVYPVIDAGVCTDCGLCARECPEDCIYED